MRNLVAFNDHMTLSLDQKYEIAGHFWQSHKEGTLSSSITQVAGGSLHGCYRGKPTKVRGVLSTAVFSILSAPITLLCILQFMFKYYYAEQIRSDVLWQHFMKIKLIHRSILMTVSQSVQAHLGLCCRPFFLFLSPHPRRVVHLYPWYSCNCAASMTGFSFSEVDFELSQLILLTSLSACPCWCTIIVKCKGEGRME